MKKEEPTESTATDRFEALKAAVAARREKELIRLEAIRESLLAKRSGNVNTSTTQEASQSDDIRDECLVEQAAEQFQKHAVAEREESIAHAERTTEKATELKAMLANQMLKDSPSCTLI